MAIGHGVRTRTDRHLVACAAVLAAALVALAGCNPRGERKDAYTEQLDALRSVDPALIGYIKTASFDVALETPRALVVGPGDTVLVAGDKKILTYDAAGALAHSIALGDEPQCLARSNDGELFVGYHRSVEVLDGEGTVLRSHAVGGDDSHFTSIALLEDGIIVADAGARVVLRLAPDGTILGRIGERDPTRNIPGFVIPSPYFDVAMGADGLLRVANPGRHEVEAYTLEGDLEFSWGAPSTGIAGFSGCCNPCNFAIAPDGSFVTAEKGLPRVKVYDESGTFQTVVAAPDQFGAGHVAPDVDVDAAGRVFVIDTESKRVLVYEKTSDGGTR